MKRPKITQEDFVYVVGLVDHECGNAYQQEKHFVDLPYAFTTALDVLTRCDHVCITDRDTYDSEAHDYMSLAPYSINISVGQYAMSERK